MRTTRIALIILPLVFAGFAVGAADAPQGPAVPQTPAPWPPKAVSNPPEGIVPDFAAKNEVCMECHSKILKEENRGKDTPNLHARHLNSKKIAYEGKNRDCVTCHEMIRYEEGAKQKKKEGWSVEGEVYHPNATRAPRDVWKKLIVRLNDPEWTEWQQTVHLADPYTFKTSLKRLVCLECHGSDSKIKTFYGVPEQ